MSTVADLVAYRSESDQVLYDLPNLPILEVETIAPVCFLPEYDNILIAHKVRSRILPESFLRKVFLSARRAAGKEVIDGFVAATWKVQKN